MTDEGIRVVRQWLGATNQVEEGELLFHFLHMLPDCGQLYCSGTTANIQNASSLKNVVSI